MSKRWWLLSVIFLLPHMVLSQRGYYVKDTVMIVGAKLLKGNERQNAMFCHVKNGDQVIAYSPLEVSQYGFLDGSTYLSKEIMVGDFAGQVFLERLVKGNTALYFYKGKGFSTYFLERDSALFMELPKKDTGAEGSDYTRYLIEMTSDCPEIKEAIKLARYRKKQLAEVVYVINSRTGIMSFWK